MNQEFTNTAALTSQPAPGVPCLCPLGAGKTGSSLRPLSTHVGLGIRTQVLALAAYAIITLAAELYLIPALILL